MFRKLAAMTTIALSAITGTTALSASPASASTYYYQTGYSMNTYYGVAGGNGYITGDQKSLVVDTYLRDKRDSYYATLQARALVTDGARSWWGPWANIRTTANERVADYGTRTLSAGAGRWIYDAQVRICQTNASGAVVGTCTRPVALDNWRTVVV